MAKRPQQNADRANTTARPPAPRRVPRGEVAPESKRRDAAPPARRSASALEPKRGGPSSEPGGWASWGAGFVVVAAAASAFFGWSAGCKHEPPPGAVTSHPTLPIASSLAAA